MRSSARVRDSAVAGSFYPASAKTLQRDVRQMLEGVGQAELPGRPVILIEPHAGYIYSGHVAAHGYRLLAERPVRTVVVISPSHMERFDHISVFDGDGYKTPIGTVPVDRTVSDQIVATSRVIRSQVLTIKERPFINSARVAGASNFRIIYLHITPNVMPMTFLYVAFAIGWAVLAEASISFLGFGDPDSISWGQILHQVFANNAFREDWWWYVPPGVCIMLFVMSAFWVGRAYEKVINPRLR